jgi:DNA polymerase-3 subunit gamma/tau
MLRRGVSVEQVLSALADHFRDLLILATCGPDSELVELSGDSRREAAAQAAKFDPAGLVHMIALCESVQRNIRMSAAPRAILDAAIVRLSLSEKFADVTAFITGGGASPGSSPASQVRIASNGGMVAKKR